MENNYIDSNTILIGSGDGYPVTQKLGCLCHREKVDVLEAILTTDFINSPDFKRFLKVETDILNLVKELKGIRISQNERVLYEDGGFSIKQVYLDNFDKFSVQRYIDAGCPGFLTTFEIDKKHPFMLAVARRKREIAREKKKCAKKRKEKEIERARKILEKANA